ncbi:MAG TPA: hypothetical protein VFS20_04965 [Longimicrobium sp.]|nr:hypothetical protein [Longimicrobium sp.]
MERPRPDIAAVQEMLRQIDDRSRSDPQYLQVAQEYLDQLVNASPAQLDRVDACPPPPASGSPKFGALRWLMGAIPIAVILVVVTGVLNPRAVELYGPTITVGMMLLLLLQAVTSYFSAAKVTGPARATGSPQDAPNARAVRAEIFEAERAKAARWARMLIWGCAALWGVTAILPFTPLGLRVPDVLTFQAIDYSGDLLVGIMLLVATLAVFYLMVNQRELVEKRADASGFAAVSRFDHREEILGTAAEAQPGTPRMEARPA